MKILLLLLLLLIIIILRNTKNFFLFEKEQHRAAKYKPKYTEILVGDLRPYYLENRNMELFDIVFINSFTDRDKTYKISLSKQNCTCPDFVDKRQYFQIGDLRRFCKHLVKATIVSYPDLQLPEAVKCLFSSAYTREAGMYLEKYQYTYIDNNLILVGYAGEGEWLSVIVEDRKFHNNKGRYKRFGYNILEERWSYGYGPPNAQIIRGLIKKKISVIFKKDIARRAVL